MPILDIPFTFLANGITRRSRTERTILVVDKFPVDVPELRSSDADGRFDLKSGHEEADLHVFGKQVFSPVSAALSGNSLLKIRQSDAQEGLDAFATIIQSDMNVDQDHGPVQLRHRARPRLLKAATKRSSVEQIRDSDHSDRIQEARGQASHLAFIDGNLYSSNLIPLIGFDVTDKDARLIPAGLDIIRNQPLARTMRLMPHVLPSTMARVIEATEEAIDLSVVASGSARDFFFDYDDVGAIAATRLSWIVRKLASDHARGEPEIPFFATSSQMEVLARAHAYAASRAPKADKGLDLLRDMIEFLRSQNMRNRLTTPVRSICDNTCEMALRSLSFIHRVKTENISDIDLDAIAGFGR